MARNGILLATGFVGGLGGAATIKRSLISLREHGIEPIIASESKYVLNLDNFGIEPNLVIQRGESFSENYATVERALSCLDYRLMISFGPRTFWPRDAINKGIPAVVVDGGLPSSLGRHDTDHDGSVYQNLEAYFQACHFPWNIPSDVLEGLGSTPVDVIARPVDSRTHQHFLSLRNITENDVRKRRNSFFQRNFGLEYDGRIFLSLRMHPTYLDESNLQENGGWLSREEYEDSLFFVRNLLTDFGESGEPLVFHMNALIADRFRDVIGGYNNLCVVGGEFLPNSDNVEMGRIAHLNIDRATRCSTEAEISMTGGHSVITPTPRKYMCEEEAALDAEKQGLTKYFPIDTPNIGAAILNYIGTDHYHSTRDTRMRVWDDIHRTRNIVDRIIDIYEMKTLPTRRSA